jgi:acyl carrier protein
MTTMYDRLVELLVDRFQVDRAEIKPGITFEDLEMDSLFLVELLVVVQSELSIALSEDTASPQDTLERAAELIDAQVAAAAAGSP